MAGLAERRGPAHDSFWTWREVMYRFLGRLTPDDVEAIAAFAYMEMLEAGFTAVGEFHYLHHDIDGRPYADLGEMAARIAAAARETGIGLTLLPSSICYGGFGGAAPDRGPAALHQSIPTGSPRCSTRSREHRASAARARVGIAPHSLRAVTPDDAARGLAAHPQRADPHPRRRADEGSRRTASPAPATRPVHGCSTMPTSMRAGA